MSARSKSLLVTPAILAALLLAGCGSSAPQRPTEVNASPSATVRAGQTEVASSAVQNGADPATARPIECPPQEGAQGAPAALKANPTSICFAQGKTTPDAADQQLLRRHAALLKQNRRLVVTLVAFTDRRGSPNYDLAVTGTWLRTVIHALGKLGVPRHQIRKDAYPRQADRPVCTGTCPPELPRVELRYRK